MKIQIIKKNSEDLWPYGDCNEVLIVENSIYSRFISVPAFDNPIDQLQWVATTFEFISHKIKKDVGIEG